MLSLDIRGAGYTGFCPRMGRGESVPMGGHEVDDDDQSADSFFTYAGTGGRGGKHGDDPDDTEDAEPEDTENKAVEGNI